MRLAAPFRSPGLVLRNFLVDFRVVISFLLITTLIGVNIATGDRPRALCTTSDYGGLLGLSLVGVGLYLRSWAAGVLRKGVGLTVGGPYSLCRHPLYLGSFLMMLGFCHLTGEPRNYLAVVVPLSAVYAVTMQNEERRLADRFSAEWANYSAATPFILPRLSGGYVPAIWDVRRWLRSREYRAVGTSLLALVVLELWRRL